MMLKIATIQIRALVSVELVTHVVEKRASLPETAQNVAILIMAKKRSIPL